MDIYIANPLRDICCAIFYKGAPTRRQLAGRCEKESGYDAPIPKTPKVHGIEEGFTTPIVYASF